MTAALYNIIKLFSNRMYRTARVCLMLSLSASTALSADYIQTVTAKLLKKSTVTANGAKIAYPKSERAEVTAMSVELAPGGQTGWHKHPLPVLAYVVSGHLTVEMEGGTTISYGPGDAIIEVVDAWHNGNNTGDIPVRLAVFYLGVEETANVIKR